MKLADILRAAHEHDASDIHLISHHTPMIRVNTVITPLDFPVNTPESIEEVLRDMISEDQWARFEEQHDLGSQLAEDPTARRPTGLIREHRHGFQPYAGPKHDGYEEQADNHTLSRVDRKVEYRGVGQDGPHQND